jgi:hypothetical protein
LQASSLNDESDKRPLHDPFGLYSENTKERQDGRIRPLEPRLKVNKPVLDPLNLYSSKKEVDQDVDMSEALPFLPRPATLTRELAGDVGFDPFNFSDSADKLAFQRRAELKHARIAMLAAIGWPLAEIFDKTLAQAWHLPALLNTADRVPSILNGGLDKINPLYWLAVLSVAAAIEIKSGEVDLNWDPLSFNNKNMELAEVVNGRLAMLAIVGFALQEFVTKVGVVHETPLFFYPLGQAVQMFLASPGASV